MEKLKIEWKEIENLIPQEVELYYVDYRDSLDESMELIQEVIEKKDPYILYEKIYDCYDSPNYDYYLKELSIDLQNRFDIDEDEASEIIEEHYYEITDLLHVRDGSDILKKLARNSSDIPIRITLHSNYDVLSSGYSCGVYGYEYESYFGDLINALYLNPYKVKKMLNDMEITTIGKFPNYKYREGKELVSYEDLHKEMINHSNESGQLVFVATIDLKDLYKNDFNLNEIVVPKGNNAGIFSSWVGGGSVIEMELQRDFKINLNKKKSKYDYWSVKIDARRIGNGYTIKEVYGVASDFFGDNIKILK